jgi:hypothetical protein
MGNGKWIDKKSLSGHVGSVQHLAHVETKRRRDEEAAANLQKLHETYSADPIDPVQSTSLPSPNARAEMYNTPRAPSPSWEDYAAAGLTAPVIPSYMTRTATDQALEAERLQKQVEMLLAQAEEEEDEDEDPLGETINTLRDLGAWLNVLEYADRIKVQIPKAWRLRAKRLMPRATLPMFLWTATMHRIRIKWYVLLIMQVL